jgi:hypothetical protein
MRTVLWKRTIILLETLGPVPSAVAQALALTIEDAKKYRMKFAPVNQVAVRKAAASVVL